MNMIRIICAWCKANLGTKRADNLPVGSVSHGICEACAKKFLEQAKQKKEDAK